MNLSRVLLAASALLWAGCLRAAKMPPSTPDQTTLRAPLPTSAPEVVVAPLAFAQNDYKGCLVVGGLKCKEMVPMVFTSFLVKAGDHTLLIDAAAGADFEEWLGLMRRWEQRLTDVDLSTHIGAELARFQVKESDLFGVLVTHAHYDHVGGLSDFQQVKIYAPDAELEYVAGIEKDWQHGVMPGMMSLSQVTASPVVFDGPAVGTFPSSKDLFGDGSVILLPLPGHTPGSMAVLLPNVNGRPVLFVGDMVWNRQGLEKPSFRPRFTSNKVDWDREKLAESMHRVIALQKEVPGLLVVPSHDLIAWKEVQEVSKPWVLPAAE